MWRAPVVVRNQVVEIDVNAADIGEVGMGDQLIEDTVDRGYM